MKKVFTLLFIFACLASAVAQTQSPPLGLIPLPQRVTQGSGHYNLLTNSRITVADGLDEATLVSVRRVANELSVSAEELKAATNYNEDALRTLEDDGIIIFSNEAIIMQPSANQYVRNVAACLDKLMVNTHKQFSNAV